VPAHVLAVLVRKADATNGTLLRDVDELAAILRAHGLDIPGLPPGGHVSRQTDWWSVLFDRKTPDLIRQVVIEVRAALPIGYRVGPILLWPPGVPTIRQQRARVRAIRKTLAELLRAPAVSPEQVAAWWKPDFPLRPVDLPAKARTAFVIDRMQHHLRYDTDAADDAASLPEVTAPPAAASGRPARQGRRLTPNPSRQHPGGTSQRPSRRPR
jgi:hypothetical protein